MQDHAACSGPLQWKEPTQSSIDVIRLQHLTFWISPTVGHPYTEVLRLSVQATQFRHHGFGNAKT
jgi:hypothetical protein